jgi:hypothetical protein
MTLEPARRRRAGFFMSNFRAAKLRGDRMTQIRTLAQNFM